MPYSRKSLADELTRIFERCRADLARYQTEDAESQARAGADRIVRDRFTDDEVRELAVSTVADAERRAMSALDSAKAALERELVAAPSTDEANYIAAIAQRSDMTEREIDAALAAYGSHAAQRAIRAAATRSGFKSYGTRSDAERELDAIDALRKSVSRTYGSPESMAIMSDAQARLTTAEYQTFAERGDVDAVAVLFTLGTPA